MIDKEFELNFEYPAAQQPDWAPKVERWYQLDGAAYGFCEFFTKNSEILKNYPPSIIFLGSPEGSSATDRAFTVSGASSPAKFVHTLPNVRASSLCQVMEWFGPILCIQNGENSFIKAVEEAKHFLRRANGTAWVLCHRDNQVLARVISVRKSEC